MLDTLIELDSPVLLTKESSAQKRSFKWTYLRISTTETKNAWPRYLTNRDAERYKEWRGTFEKQRYSSDPAVASVHARSLEENLKCTRYIIFKRTKATAWEAVLPVSVVYYAVQVALTFESVDKILKCDQSIERYWAVLSCSAVYYAVQGGSNVCVCWWNPKM